MITHAVEAALRSSVFDLVVVSTDDEEIAEIARDSGASVPFLRPPELADDQTPTVPVIAHAIRTLQEQGQQFDYTCCIYPCVPFFRTEDLLEAIMAQRRTGAGYAYPVAELPPAIQRAFRRSDTGTLKPLDSKYEWMRTQELDTLYYDTSQFYWGHNKAWLLGLGLHSYGAGVVIPGWRVVDIDTPDDWCRAELLFKSLQQTYAISHTDTTTVRPPPTEL